MSNIEQIRNILHSLLKKDYTVEIYNENAHYLTLSFNHLNSVYNNKYALAVNLYTMEGVQL